MLVAAVRVVGPSKTARRQSSGSRGSQQKMARRWVPTSAANGFSSVAGRFQHPVPRSQNRVLSSPAPAAAGCSSHRRRSHLGRHHRFQHPESPVAAVDVVGCSSSTSLPVTSRSICCCRTQHLSQPVAAPTITAVAPPHTLPHVSPGPPPTALSLSLSL